MRGKQTGWLVAAVTTTALFGSAQAAFAELPRYVPDQLIVQFKDGVSGSQQNRLLGKFNGGPLAKIPHLGGGGGGVVKPQEASHFSGLYASLKKSRLVAHVERDTYQYSTSKTPDDPLFTSSQYSLNASATPNLGASKAWGKKTSCTKVIVAVADTGIDTTHPDLKNNLWVNSKEILNNRDDDHNGYIDDINGVDAIFGVGSGEDRNGHGTHVSGIIGAQGNNNIGVTGVCWKAKIMSARFMNLFGAGATSDAIEAINYAVDNGAKVINASFGSSTKSSALEDAINRAKSNGVLIVAAAGNDGVNIDKTPTYPASYTESNILTVAASTSSDKLASFSNYGSTGVDVAAPGENITSTYIGGDYASMSGTSMSAPLATGMAALLFSKNSKADYKDVRKAIRRYVNKPSSLNNKVAYDGRVNIYKAIDYIQDVD